MARKPKIGRPKKQPREVRKITVQVRLSRDEYDAIAKAAPNNISKWARAELLRSAGRS